MISVRKIFEKWLGELKSKGTKRLYFTSVKHFLNCAYKVSAEPNVDYESLASKFVSESKNGRVWFDDLIAYAITLKIAHQKLLLLMCMPQRNLLRIN